MKKESKYTKHNKKRKIIAISLYSKDRELMKQKYGKILNATQAKDILLTGEFTEVKVNVNEDPALLEILKNLNKIGNNINQLAYIANARKEVPSEALLLRELRALHELRDLLEKEL